MISDTKPLALSLYGGAELNNQNTERLPTGCENLDDLLGGGIETGVITQFYVHQGGAKHGYVSPYV